jgi:hypothetical protein
MEHGIRNKLSWNTVPIWRRPLCEQFRVASRRVLPPLVMVLLTLWVLTHYVAIGPNLTGSLPIKDYPLILVLKNGLVPDRGELVAFHPGPNRFYPADSFRQTAGGHARGRGDLRRQHLLPQW